MEIQDPQAFATTLGTAMGNSIAQAMAGVQNPAKMSYVQAEATPPAKKAKPARTAAKQPKATKRNLTFGVVLQPKKSKGGKFVYAFEHGAQKGYVYLDKPLESGSSITLTVV